jgi:catechol 2,3-dioxygenase-like lactoylglutathione lyase family enzyme
MFERDGYPAGVPCRIETAQPDPEAAVSFYEGLFGWDFENVATAGAPVPYFIGRLRGKDVAAVAPQPDGAPARRCGTHSSVSTARTRPPPRRRRPVLSVWQAKGPGRPCS